MDPVWNVITTAGGWAAAVAVGVIAAFVPKKGTVENLRIDQYQEDRRDLDERLKAYSDRIDRLEKIAVWYQRRDVAWERREAQLMIGVDRGLMPPWPEREGILTEAHP